MPASGGEPREVLSENEQYFTPAWMPGGDKVAYGRESGGLWMLDLRSGDKRQLTTGGTEGAPVVSRGGKILFATFSHQTDIYVQDLDGSKEERLTFHTMDNFSAQISHDGSKVVYMSSRTGNEEIWLLDRTSGAERQLTNRDAGDWGPSWSPDDRNIVFGSDHGGKSGMWIVSVDGGALRKLGDQKSPARSPLWSPDGLAIGFISGDGGESNLYVISPEGGESRKVLDDVYSFEWYVDSKRVIYRTGDAVSARQMRAAHLETGEQAVLLEGAFSEHSVAADGKSVSYVSAMSHYNMNLHVLRLDRPANANLLPQPIGPSVAITHGDGKWHVHNGGWSPDSKQVIYTRDTDTGDIYLIEGGL
jgi:Tol biopolymer transport system component